MRCYLDIVQKILDEGVVKRNRTGIDALTVPGCYFEHDMSEGFPLLTTKKMPFRLVASELEFFIRGLTDKRWLQDRGNHVWDEWCSPEKVPYGHDEGTKRRMREERDLGPVYGFQWRHFGAGYRGCDVNYSGEGVDQLGSLVGKIKASPQDRRMIVSSWNPKDIPKMALPPCHYSFQVTVTEDKLNLAWNQRSVDVMLGLPFNIASYGLLLHLLAMESGFRPGKLVGFLMDTHVYVNHVNGAKEQLSRQPYSLPRLENSRSCSVFDWEYADSRVLDYRSHPSIKFDIAV